MHAETPRRRRLPIRAAALLAAALWPAAPGGAAAPFPPDATSVASVRSCVRANAPRRSSVLDIDLEVRDDAGERTTARFKLYWRRLPTGERRVMIRFAAPEELAGAALLVERVRDPRPRVHLFLPDLGVPRRITSREQLEGFLGRADLGLDEIGQLLDPLGGETLRMLETATLGERGVWVVETRPGEDDPSRYARTVTFVDQKMCVPLRAEFYDRDDRRARLLQVDPARVTREARSWIARELVFRNGDGDARTTLRVDAVEVDIPLAPSLLTVRALGGLGG